MLQPSEAKRNTCISAKSITHMIYVDIPEVNMEDAQEFLKAIEY